MRIIFHKMCIRDSGQSQRAARRVLSHAARGHCAVRIPAQPHGRRSLRTADPHGGHRVSLAADKRGLSGAERRRRGDPEPGKSCSVSSRSPAERSAKLSPAADLGRSAGRGGSGAARSLVVPGWFIDVYKRQVRAHPAQQLFRGCRRRTIGQIQCQMKLFKPEIK